MSAVALTILIFLYFSLFLLSLQNVHNSRDKFVFIYLWGFLFGAFVWEDLIIFSAFYVIVSMVTLLSRDLRIGLLLVAVFWIVRSAGETLYFFLQQFLEPQNSPHDIQHHFGPLQVLFGKICPQKCYILMQITFQVVCVGAISCLVLLLLNWRSVPAWIY